jgi:pimeloyl-ACP methyl ester carboxylesterase
MDTWRGFTKQQRTILITLTATTFLVIGALGCVVLTQTLRATSSPAPESEPSSTAVGTPPQVTLTPEPTPISEPTLPPTWTPRPTRMVQPPAGHFEEAACPFDEPWDVEVECGHFYVSEDRDGDPTDTISLAVAVYHSTAAEPAPDPVIYLHGGPGGDAVEGLHYRYEGFIEPILKSRDLIVFDQRGAGLSEPRLSCREYSKLIKRELRQGYVISDQPADRQIEALLTCNRRLVAEGVNPAAYTSAASAADVREMVASFGYDQVNLYGVSYGTRLALTIMRDYPEIVKSVVLDSAVPVEANIYEEQAYKASYAFGKLFGGCAQDPACSRAYPDLEDVYNELVEELNAHPVEVWGITPSNGRTFNATVSGIELSTALFFAMYSREMVPLAPAMLYQVWYGDYRLLTAFMGAPLATEEGISIGAMLSINCHEEIFATTPDRIEAAYAPYPETKAFAKAAFYNDVESHFELCESWGAAPFDPLEAEPVVSDIPTLILAGEYDPATPPDFGFQIDKQLNNSYFFEFPGEAHGVGVVNEDCALPMVLEFINTPAKSPDAGCIAEMGSPDFLVP